MAKKKAGKESNANMTEVVISGRGLSFSVLDIDQETFVRFTQSGITNDEFDDLRDQLDEAGYYITAPFLDETTVSIDGRQFHGSWKNIKGQCGDLPKPTRIYEVPPGSYSVILAILHKGEFARARIAGFDPSKLTFDVEHVHLAKGREYVLLDPYYNTESLKWGETRSESDIYVVDGKGKRYYLRIAGDN